MQKQPSDLVGTRPMNAKQALLDTGAIFVYRHADLIYLVSKVIDEAGNAAYKIEVISFDEDYLCVYVEYYASLTSLEAYEPLQLSKFSVVYTMPAARSLVSQDGNKGISRGDIIQAVIGYVGIGWSVENITPYELHEDVIPPGKHWQAWLTTVTRPYMGTAVAGFLLAVHNGECWLVLRPTAMHAPIGASLEDIKCEFFVPGYQEIQGWIQEENEDGEPIAEP